MNKLTAAIEVLREPYRTQALALARSGDLDGAARLVAAVIDVAEEASGPTRSPTITRPISRQRRIRSLTWWRLRWAEFLFWVTEDAPAVPHRPRRRPWWPWLLGGAGATMLLVLATIGLITLIPGPPVPATVLLPQGPVRYDAQGVAIPVWTPLQRRELYYWQHDADFSVKECHGLPPALPSLCLKAVAVQQRFPPARTLGEPHETYGQRVDMLQVYRDGAHLGTRLCALLPTAYVEDCVHDRSIKQPPGPVS